MPKTVIETETALQKLSDLRHQMVQAGVQLYLVPSADEHLNEYLPPHKMRRQWLTGFTGSAGDCLVGMDNAWLFVDSRYHDQADLEVALDLFSLCKLGQKGQLTLSQQLKSLLLDHPGWILGADPLTVTSGHAEALTGLMEKSGGQFKAVEGNLVDTLWKDLPEPIRSRVFALPEAVSGEALGKKLSRVRAALLETDAEILPVTKLDQVAWLFNLRGQDIPYNPVFMAYAILTPDQAFLFTDSDRICWEDLSTLKQHVEIMPYDGYTEHLKKLSTSKSVLIDAKHTTLATRQWVLEAEGQLVKASSPVEMLKAQKNQAEVAGMYQANLASSRAKVRALAWLYTQQKAKQPVTEETFRQALEQFYSEEPGFFGLSFNTISATGKNGAIVHYGTPSPKTRLKQGELFLVDSGSQYLTDIWAGTTDDTRTVAIGKPDALQRKRYTLVLKAHIQCAMQRFPQGTNGAQLDSITRSALWNQELNFGHGTGHGVGAFLNVHEGPNGIHRMAETPLEPGMVTSIEPGFYETGWGGIRLENLYVVVELPNSPNEEGTRWFGFDPLIYIPFDKRLMIQTALTSAEKQWLKRYHQQCQKRVSMGLSPIETRWLDNACKL
ncbi:MAG: aminopeptidase P family protein [Vampirovibrio sp.]|nr:aminopeptidase P family protein [Vampirovibrio sp.]